jgi:type IX secretion system PorP/SprF family membrane protein
VAPSDPSVFGKDVTGESHFDVNAGLWLYSAKYFVGLSVNQLAPQTVDYSWNLTGVTKGKLVPHYFATAGYKFFVSEDISMLPSVMVKSLGSSIPAQADVNVKAQYQDLLWVGASYRNKYGFAGMAGVNVAKTVTISYSYDYTTTNINTVSKGTHEILLGFVFGNKYNDDTCPRRLW